MSTPYKPMPGYPGYRINRHGKVKNANGYVVASGRGASLFVGGKGVYVSRKRLLAIAAELFGPGQGEPAPASRPGPVQEAQEVQPPAPAPARPARERTPERTNPTRALGLRCPWSDGTIEQKSPWDWQVVL